MTAPTYFAAITVKIATGQPPLADKESLRNGTHTAPCYVIVPRGDQLGQDALDLLTDTDVADMLRRGQISETPPEATDPSGWGEVPPGLHPIDDAAA